MFHRSLLGVAALAAAASVVTVAPSAHAATPSASTPTFTGSSYAAKLPGVAAPAGLDGFECKNLPKLPSLPSLPTLPLPKGGGLPDVPPVVAGGDLDLAGLGTVTDMSTDTKLLKQDDGSYGVTSTNSIGDVNLDLGPLGTIDIAGLDVNATATTASADADSVTAVGIGDITYTGADGVTHTIDLPTPGNSSVIPGVATISLGGSTTANGVHTASAIAQGLIVKLAKTGKTLVLGGASAGTTDGDVTGIAKAGELDPSSLLDLLCNTDPQDVLEQLASLPPTLLDKAGIEITKDGSGADATYSVKLGPLATLQLGLGKLSAETGLANVELTAGKDHLLTVSADADTASKVSLEGTPLSKIPGLADGISIPSLASLTADLNTTDLGASVNQLTLTALDDTTQLVLVDGLDLTLVPADS